MSVQSEDRDEAGRTQRTTLRYERHAPGESTLVDRVDIALAHPAGIPGRGGRGGLSTTTIRDRTGQPASDDATEFTFLLRPAPERP